jgi:hypothetical protein
MQLILKSLIENCLRYLRRRSNLFDENLFQEFWMTAIHIRILQCQHDSQLSILTRFKNYSSFHLDKPQIPVGA